MGKSIAVRNPRTGLSDYEIAPTPPKDIEKTARKARQAARGWQGGSHEDRARTLKNFQQALTENRDGIITALTEDTGRHGISVVEVDGVIRSIDKWIGIAGKHQQDESRAGHPTALPGISYGSELKPYDLIGVVSPWNFPCTLSMIDALPALMAGCAVIIKPSEITPRFAGPLRDAVSRVPALKDLVHIIDGDGRTGASLIEHVDALCFTGSVATGRKVAVAAAENFIPAFLELGGNDPAIVLEDADIERASTALLRASVLNTGQACQSIERIYVARSRFDAFCDSLVEKTGKLCLSRDLSDGHVGPLIFHKQAEIIQSHLDDAVAGGAKIMAGGAIHRDGGTWVEPTIVVDVKQDMKLMQEETFGPVMPVMPFDSDEEAVELANDTVFGLSAAVFSENLDHAYRIARQIDAGGISINDGALTGLVGDAEKNSFKLSGMGGSRMGEAGYLRFFRRKSLLLQSGDPFDMDMFNEANAPARKP